MRLLLLADTHVPARARDLPHEVWDAVDDADVVIHAGDWISLDLVDRLSARAARLVACWGNNDGAPIRAALPEIARTTLAGLRFVVVHETGPSAGRDRRMAAAHPDADVLVFGHSHIPWDSTVLRSSTRQAAGGGRQISGGRQINGHREADSVPASGAFGPDDTPTRPLRLLNPGSPTDRRRQPTCTYLTATIADGSLTGVELHHLMPRAVLGRIRR
ncbi:metallophosphoesterase [Frankia sp. CNm7]|uniref:Phosphoesterase n=1 Tax=Frankia nepalensis TaxID=1836974 RepID=A0A937RFC3_9ACTN|nr:metallophosphoesterase [Frankia nepalensis]MBL7498166.1 metallophosphoesterase [Frankia nepalensis]MBL7509316.1 metallophosphoesterase [Frankia nepalensis]MBL7516896.1 metallophosphoesterase [Frankia nepalensis]MBL7627955.1 metallophosphoesterase [Frankia nepalensis]